MHMRKNNAGTWKVRHPANTVVSMTSTITNAADLVAEIREDKGDVTVGKDVQSNKDDSGMDETLGSADLTLRSDDEDVIPKRHSRAKQMVFDDDDDNDDNHLTGPEDHTEIPSNSTEIPAMSQEALQNQTMASADDDSDDDGPFPRLTIVEEDDVVESGPQASMSSILQNSDLFDAEQSDGEPGRGQDSNGEEEEEDDNRESRGSNDEEDEGFDDSGIDPALLRKLQKMKGAAKKAKGKKTAKEKKQDDLLHLHSETQRLIRESRVSLPYHQPTPKSLDDFLARAKKKQQEYSALRGAPDLRKAEVIQQVIGTKTPAREKSRRKKADHSERDQEVTLGEDGLPLLKSSRSTKPVPASKRLQSLGDFELPEFDALPPLSQPPASSQPLASSHPGLFDDDMDDDDLPDFFLGASAESNAADEVILIGEESSKEQLTEPQELEAPSSAFEDVQAPAEGEMSAGQDVLLEGVKSKDSTETPSHIDTIQTEEPLSPKQASIQRDSGVDATSGCNPSLSNPVETSTTEEETAKPPSSLAGISCSDENPVDSTSVQTTNGSRSGTGTPNLGSVSEDLFGDMDRPSIVNIAELDSDCEIPCGQGISMPSEGSSKHSQDFKSQSARRMQEWLSGVESATQSVESAMQSRANKDSYSERPGPSEPRRSMSAKAAVLKDLDLQGIQPKLSGDPDSFIMLDEDEKEQDGLFKHPGTPSFKTSGRSLRQPKDVIISIVEKDYSNREDGELKVKTITYHPDPAPVVVDDKPGHKLHRLQERLAVEMRMKREEARKKRMEIYALENEEGFEIGDDAEPEEDIEEEEEMTDESDTEDEDELEEEEFVEEKKRPKNPFVCEEADEEDEDYAPDEDVVDEDDDNEGSSDDNEEGGKSGDAEDAEDNSEAEVYSSLPFDESDDDEAKGQSGKTSQRKSKKPKTYIISDDEESADHDPQKTNNISQELETSPMHQPTVPSPEETKDEEKKKAEMTERSPLVSFKSLDSLMATPSQAQGGNRLLALPSTSTRLLQGLPAPSTQDINDLLGLARAKSQESQAKSGQSRRKLPFEVYNSPVDDDMEELLGLCSGKFSTQKSQSQGKGQLDDERGDDEKDDGRTSPVSFVISDGEMEDRSENEELGSSEKENVDDDEVEDNDDDDDDSRHSELSDEEHHEKFGGFTIDNRHGKIRREFVEDEAELSGSEFESDENEDLAEEDDIMDYEEGDLDRLKEDQLREQVGRVHMKQMLDEDKRELLRYQEMYLPDGDLYSGGKGRMRRFAWKNMDDSSQRDMFEDSEEEGESPDDPEELAWRKERFERQKFLKEQEKPESEELGEEANKPKKIGLAILHKPTIKTVKQKPRAVPALNDKLLTPPKKMKARGSLLSRGKEHLNRLAEITKTSTNQGKASASGNFVFQVLSPSKQPVDVEAPQSQPEVKRRIAHEPPAKKPRLETPRLGRQSSVFSSLERRKAFSQ